MAAVDWAGNDIDVTSSEGAFNLSGLIKRVPQINKSGSATEDHRRSKIRKGFVKILQIFEKDNSKILQTLTDLELADDGDKEEKSDLKWPNTYTKIGRLPKYWKAAFLTDVSQQELSREVLSKVDAKDEAAVDMIFSLVTQTAPEVPLPRVCIVKATCKRFFAERVKQLGDRWKGWVERAVRDDGTIDWAKGGPYQIEWTGNGNNCKATTITYISGDSLQVPDYLNIKKTFKCESPHKDMESRLVKDGFGVTLADLFKAENNGPWKYRVCPKDMKNPENPFAKLVKKYQDEVNAQVAQQKAGQELCKPQAALEGDKQRKVARRLSAKTRAEEQAVKRKRTLAF